MPICSGFRPALKKAVTICSTFCASTLFRYEVPEADISSFEMEWKKNMGFSGDGQGKSNPLRILSYLEIPFCKDPS